MAFEITVHALLLEVISESRLSFYGIALLIGIGFKLAEQLFLFFALKNSKLIWSPV
jgi:hypothetical protein